MELINPAPSVKPRAAVITRVGPTLLDDDEEREPIDPVEIFEHVRDIVDPEHPQYTLEQLSVVDTEHIDVDDARGRVSLQFIPTVEHCSMATLIGLCLRCKLELDLLLVAVVAPAASGRTHRFRKAGCGQQNTADRLRGGR